MKLPLINGFITRAGYTCHGGGNAVDLRLEGNETPITGTDTGVRREVFVSIDDFRTDDGGFVVGKIAPKKLYVPSLKPDEKFLDSLTEFALTAGARLMVRTASTLEEVGLLDAKFGLPPIQLLHRLGLLENAVIVGGVWLDKDDAALMRQSNAELVLLPTSDMGSGYGVPPVVSMLSAQVRVRLGTADCAFNPTANLLAEAYVLELAVSAALNKPRAIGDIGLSELLTGSPDYADTIGARLFDNKF